MSSIVPSNFSSKLSSTMKKIIICSALGLSVLFVTSCGGNNTSEEAKTVNDTSTPSTAASEPKSGENPSYDPHRGEGKFTKVDVGASLDPAKAEAGQKV